jgi:hypothetical protein
LPQVDLAVRSPGHGIAVGQRRDRRCGLIAGGREVDRRGAEDDAVGVEARRNDIAAVAVEIPEEDVTAVREPAGRDAVGATGGRDRSLGDRAAVRSDMVKVLEDPHEDAGRLPDDDLGAAGEGERARVLVPASGRVLEAVVAVRGSVGVEVA